MAEKKLNTEQLQAIKHKSGPLLIIAGAGTGKTTVITERVKYLIEKGLAEPEGILALTFTEKGAKEMQDRIDVALPLSYGNMWIMTFHSFCDQILRDNAIHIGLSPKYKLMTTAQSVDLIRKNIFEFGLDYFRPLGNPNKFIEGLLQHFSRLQDELVSPDEYLSFSKKYKSNEELEVKKVKELALCYKRYVDLKIKENVMDFGDLVVYANQLFIDRPNVLHMYQEKFKYILVDEFQDTNFAQNKLINLLALKYKNVTIVGDDNQSIYRFRGAAISNILQFRNTYPEAKVVTLNKNYRSTQRILDSAYNLIKFNDPDTLEYQLKISKKLNSINKDKEDDITFLRSKVAGDEAEKVAEEVVKLVQNKKNKISYGDIAILVRANNHADPFVREFERNDIPHQFLGPSKLFDRDEIVDLISYLKVLYNPEDSVSFYRLLSSDTQHISSLDLIKISTFSRKKNISIFETIAENNELILSEDTRSKISRLIKLIQKHLEIINKETAGQILYDYISHFEILTKIYKNGEETKAKNISTFFDKIKSYEMENRDSGVVSVVNYLDLLIEVGESPVVTDTEWQENDAVNILTVHSSKGLEFPVVFMVNLVNERFPSRERHEQIPIPMELIKEILPKGDYHIQEERRLFYVGMTRAKKKLYFTASDFYGDGKRIKKISPFVYEALGDSTDASVSIKPNTFYKEVVKVQEEKKDKIEKKIKINYLSVSQIETFKTCPMHYKLKYIYKIPSDPSASISFGISIHNTMKDLFERKGDILDIYKSNWINEGYLNKKHKEEFYKKGEKYLLEFVKNEYSEKTKTISLEQKFSVSISKTLKIGGTIDRIDQLGKDTYEIIDYKTGTSVPTQKEVDKDMQLSFYALAVSKIYNVSPENIKLSLYYFDTQEKINTRRTSQDLDDLKNRILDIRDEIESSDFKCSNGFFCQSVCEYSMFCKN